MVMYEILVLFHVLAVIVAVGAVSVTDYLHLVALKRKKLEKQLKDVYPNLSKLINFSLVTIILTGILLVIQKPELLSSQLFLLKMTLVFVVSINGFYLQKSVAPNLDLCVIKGTKYCTNNLLYSSAVCGSISIVTWFSIVILAFTKTLGYSYVQFLTGYLVCLAIAILIALVTEKKARKWRD